MRTILTYACLALAALLVPRADGAESAPAAKDWAFVLDSTYEQRVAANPVNQPAEAAALALPQPSALKTFPAPFSVEAGKTISDDTTDKAGLIWQLVPDKAADPQFLEKWNALASPDSATLDLVNWCEQNKLPECAEFTLRCMLRKFKTYTEPGYQPIYTRWLKYADQHRTRYCFPLPVNGEWFTQPSPVHRLHAESTYAMDLVAVKDGSPLKKAPTRMEDYYSWGQPVLAQADGVVVLARDNNPDNKLGEMRGMDANNFVFVDYGGVIGNYAHIQQGSAKVKTGDHVKAGDVLALVGASGAANVPHLHYTLRDAGWFSIKGRLRFEVKTGTTWKRIDGEELKENMTVRNVDKAFETK